MMSLVYQRTLEGRLTPQSTIERDLAYATLPLPVEGGGIGGRGLIGVSSAATMLPLPVEGGGIGGKGLIGVSSAATMLPLPVEGGGIGGRGLIGVSSAATMLPLPVEGGGSGGRGLIGDAKAEEAMVAARIELRITEQIFVQMDFMGEGSLIGRNTLQRKGNPNRGDRLPQK